MTKRLAICATTPDAGPTPRGQPRRKTFRPVVLRIGEDRHRAHMLNLSTGGACLHATRCPLRVWHAVDVDVDGRVMQGRVSWVAGERCGVRFLKPLTAAEVEGLVG